MQRILIGCTILLSAGTAAVASARDTPLDACALVTRAEAGLAIGAGVGEGKPLAVPQRGGVEVSSCDFRTGGMAEFQLTLYHFSPAMKQSIEVYRGLCKEKETVAGLGEVACWYNSRHNELQVLKGSTVLIFKLERSGSPTEPLITVARQALARMH